MRHQRFRIRLHGRHRSTGRHKHDARCRDRESLCSPRRRTSQREWEWQRFSVGRLPSSICTLPDVWPLGCLPDISSSGELAIVFIVERIITRLLILFGCARSFKYDERCDVIRPNQLHRLPGKLGPRTAAFCLRENLQRTSNTKTTQSTLDLCVLYSFATYARFPIMRSSLVHTARYVFSGNFLAEESLGTICDKRRASCASLLTIASLLFNVFC